MSVNIPPVVLVTDSKSANRAFDIEHSDSEGYFPQTIDNMIAALNEFAPSVTHFDSAREFARESQRFTDAIVLPFFFGPASRTCKTWIPAICESQGIRYVGADSYTQALCNDKYISKLYAASLGLESTASILIRSENDVKTANFDCLTFPVVVKPNFGGGSNGIAKDNVCKTPAEARQLASHLLKKQGLPILIESYLPGFEVNTMLVAMPEGEIMTGQIGVSLQGESYFTEKIFSLESKKRGIEEHKFTPVDIISERWLSVFKSIFASFAKVGMMRIDCRVDKDGTPRLLELSPDCSLSMGSGMFLTFRKAGYSYAQMFQTFIEAELES